MEEHIGRRINHERVDEALATGAGTIATGCPFCRVMVPDGVNAGQEEAGRSGVEVLDVAQVLLGSLDYDKAKLPEKGTAAKEAEERAAKAAPKAAVAAPTAPAEAPAEAEAKAEELTEKAAPEKATKAVTGWGIAGGAKKPGAKTAAAEPSDASASAAPAKGLGLAAGTKKPGAKT